MIKSSLWFGVYSVLIFRIIRETPNIDIWVMWRALRGVCRYNAYTWSFVSSHMCPQRPVITAGVLYKRWGTIKKHNLQMMATSERLSGSELFINQSRAPSSTKPIVKKGLLLWISQRPFFITFLKLGTLWLQYISWIDHRMVSVPNCATDIIRKGDHQKVLH